MELLKAFQESEIDRVEKETKRKIERLQIKLWVQHPEYEERYNSIMQDYELEVQRILNI